MNEPVSVPVEVSRATRSGRRSTGAILLMLLLLVLAGAGAYAAFHPALVASLKDRIFPTPSPALPPTTGPVAHENPASPQPTEPAAVDCSRTYGPKLDDLSRLSDMDKVTLGESAVHDGCGAAAFRVFDTVDWQSNEAAAWNVARFYDPNETAPVYRQVATEHPDYAAAYYKFWRDRSPRHASALAKICSSRNGTGGGASLQQSCAR